MGLVTTKEIAKALKVDKLGFLGTLMGWSVMKVLNISTCNKIYDRNKHLSGLEFIDALLEEFEVDYEIPEEDLKRNPKLGPFITISNHPLVGIDGILFLKLLRERRSHDKMLATFLLPPF